MKKIISYILLAVSVFCICVSNVFALAFDEDSIVLPTQLKEGNNTVTITSYDGYSKYYQILDVSNNSEMVEDYNAFMQADDMESSEAYLTSLETGFQEENWEALTNNTFEVKDLSDNYQYLVVVKLINPSDSSDYLYNFKLYKNSAAGGKNNVTENKDTGINDTLLIVGVPVLLITGVYLTTKKQYN